MSTVDVYGFVEDSSGNNVSGATVEAVPSGSTTVYAKTTSTSDGEFVLELESGVNYTLTATKTGESNLTVQVEGGVAQDSLSLGIGFTAVQASY